MPRVTGGSARDPALRLCAFYMASFTVLGVFAPYWPLWLQSHGCSEQLVGRLGTLMILARTVAGPLWAQRADRQGGPRATLRLLSVLSLLAFAPFVLADGLLPLVLCTLAFGVAYPPIHALLDSLTLTLGREQGFAYGRVRVWGSVAFLLVCVTAGELMEGAGVGLVYWVALAGLVAMAFASRTLPTAATVLPHATGRPLLTLLRSGPFVLFLLAVGLIMSSHAAYTTYGAIHWDKAGISEGAIGWLFAEGVVAEIILFRMAPWVLARVPALWLLGLGAIGGIVRWCVLGTTSALPALIAVQWLHGLSFGCTHLGALQWIQERVSAERSTTAQGLAAAVASGACSALATEWARVCYPAVGGPVFFWMAGIAVLGGLCALLLARLARA